MIKCKALTPLARKKMTEAKRSNFPLRICYCNEYYIIILNKTAEEGQFNYRYIYSNSRFTNLCLANDLLIFVKGSLRQLGLQRLESIQRILLLLELHSSLAGSEKKASSLLCCPCKKQNKSSQLRVFHMATFQTIIRDTLTIVSQRSYSQQGNGLQVLVDCDQIKQILSFEQPRMTIKLKRRKCQIRKRP